MTGTLHDQTETTADVTQLERLNALLAHTWECNPFYRAKWERAGLARAPLDSVEGLHAFPFTTRVELIADQAEHPPLGTNLAAPLGEFKRFVHSSGTTRRPMFWADTARSWDWVTRCSATLHRITGVRPNDDLLFMGNLGGASGPWVILEGARRLGCTCLTCNGQDVSEGSRWLALMHPNVLVGKPEPLLMLAMALRAHGQSPASAGIQRVIVTGQGSSVDAAPRAELEECWAAPCFDRYGLTEAGSVAAECVAHTGGLHVLDDEFIVEIVDPSSGAPMPDGSVGELVLTNLGRIDRPIVRFRTGDRTWCLRNHHCSCGREGTVLPRGVLGRLT